MVPTSELAAARAEIAKLQRVLGKRRLEHEIPKQAVEYAAEEKWIARSNVHRLQTRSENWTDARTCRTLLAGDAVLFDEIRDHITKLLICGYRRA